MPEPIVPEKGDIIGPQATPPGEQEIPEQAPSGKQFEPLMEGPANSTEGAGVSPLDLPSGQVGQAMEVNPQVLQDHAQRLADKAGQLQGIITPERFNELTPGQRSLLNTKLTQFSEHVKGLSDQQGLAYEVPKPDSGAMKAVKTYVSWLTDSQKQIQTVAAGLGAKGGGQMSVADMLRAQAKLTAADRAINFATAVAGKGTSFITQIMQTQI